MSEALAPQRLSSLSLPWLLPVWHDLIRRQQQHGLPHALMLTGPRGVGKHELAHDVAQWLLCQQRVTQGLRQACGQCHSCQLWQAGNHPDFMACQPEDGSRQIRIDGVRKVNEFLVQTPQISPCQVVTLAPVEVLNINAANALLKTLEEPPGECYLLLQTERHGSVMPTIRSRCQRIALTPPTEADACQWLQQQGIAEPQALKALKANQRAPLAALAWCRNDAHSQHQAWLQNLMAWSRHQASLEQTVNAWRQDELVDVVEWLANCLADLMKLAMQAPAEQVIEPALAQCLEPATLDRTKLLALYDRTSAIGGQIRSGLSYHNRQLVLETLMIEWRSLAVATGRN